MGNDGDLPGGFQESHLGSIDPLGLQHAAGEVIGYASDLHRSATFGAIRLSRHHCSYVSRSSKSSNFTTCSLQSVIGWKNSWLKWSRIQTHYFGDLEAENWAPALKAAPGTVSASVRSPGVEE
jgi:hypothetical protein